MPDTDQARPIVVKVGGSLFDMPELGTRLTRFLESFESPRTLVVPGGGALVDLIRARDRTHGLGDEACHWLALAAMTVNARFVIDALANHESRIAIKPIMSGDASQWPRLWRKNVVLILDAMAFAHADETDSGRLPHGWNVTSDSVAARVAIVAHARRLIVLKSIDVPPQMRWNEAVARGMVDPFFPSAIGDFEVDVINFRRWTPEAT